MKITKRLLVVLMVLFLGVSSFVLAQERPYEGIRLAVALRSLPETDFIVSKLGEFELMTGISVNVVTYPEEQLREREVIDATTGAGAYDVIAIDSVFIPEFAKAGWITPLEPYLKPEYEVEDISKFARDLLSYEGTLYGGPVYSEATQLMYQKSLFEDAGLAPPQTMEEYEEYAKKFTQPPDLYGVAMRGLRGNGMNIYIWSEWLWSYGGRYFDENWNPVFNSPEGVLATEKYAYLLQNYGPPGVATYGWDDVQNAFTTGKVAMIIDATNFYTRIEDPTKSQVAGNVGYAVVPEGPAGRFPGNYCMGFAISAVGAKTDEEKKAAAEFIQWATSREMELDKSLQADIISVTRDSVFNDPEFRAKFGGDWLESTMESFRITNPNYRPLIEEWREIGDRLGIEVENVIAGIKPAKEALDEAAAYAAEVLKKTGKIK
ncbi:ABC transporter substrate-binding protein [Candidatus Sordicultor fermentans]|uniref:ABC transporter substrate-binding protein n=1 Tax=Candidatus Sordicultor fermentans TaxID=1953203 RepID=UPI0016ABAB6E|nr:sugar ABC transporter substrate-binding protein [Candidatus Atribacteria bacterium]